MFLWKKEQNEKPDPCDYWEIVKQKNYRLTINKGSFYLLRSKELFSLPSHIAVYCRTTDETIGEMRIHYAGFVHPFFGKTPNPKYPGTPLIFEVRGHCADVNLRDGEKLAQIVAYRMSEEAEPDASEYEEQTLKLSSFFGDFPDNMRDDNQGRLYPIG